MWKKIGTEQIDSKRKSFLNEHDEMLTNVLH